MSLKQNIGSFRPASALYGKINWKEINEQNLTPFSFFFKFTGTKTGTGKDNNEYETIQGLAELDTSNLSDGQILDREQMTDIPRDRPIEVSFFIVGNMFITQMQKTLNKNLGLGFDDKDKEGQGTIKWRELGIGKLFHIKYTGLKKVKDTSKTFHQVWINLVPQPTLEQAEL